MRRPFYELVRLGGLWANMSPSLRRKHAPDLAALAREAATILGDEPPHDPEPAANQLEAPTWTRRADVGG